MVTPIIHKTLLFMCKPCILIRLDFIMVDFFLLRLIFDDKVFNVSNWPCLIYLKTLKAAAPCNLDRNNVSPKPQKVWSTGIYNSGNKKATYI